MIEMNAVVAGTELDAARDAGREGASAGWCAWSAGDASLTFSLVVRPAVEGRWEDSVVSQPFVVTVDGPDRPGLIAAMSRVFARHGVNIDSLKAVLGQDHSNHALFVFEVKVPESADLGRLRRELASEGQAQGLRVSVQHRDIFEAVHRIGSF